MSCSSVISSMGLPASRPNEKHALITPENVATRMPFLKSNSLIDAFFCSSDISRSLDMPAIPATTIPAMHTNTLKRTISPGTVVSNLSEQLTMEDRRDQRAERRGIAEGNRHSQRHAEVAHGQAEGQAAHPPQDSEEVGQEQGRARRLADDRRKFAGHDQPERPGGNDPAKETTRQPVGFPGPLADEPVRDVKAARGQPAEPVEDNAEERIGGHGGSGELRVASCQLRAVITPARKFRMPLHINPTCQRGKRTGSLARASGWYMTFFAAGVIVASAERLVPGDFPMNSSPLATHSRPLRQHLGLVAFDCVEPGRADGHFPGPAVIIPHRAERQRLELFQQRQPRGEIARGLQLRRVGVGSSSASSRALSMPRVPITQAATRLMLASK